MSIKDSGLSRPSIVDRMNSILEEMGLDREVTLDQINSWTKNEESRVIPTVFLPVFCQATNSLFSFQVLLQPLGARILDIKDEPFLELGKAEALKRVALKKEKSALEKIDLRAVMDSETPEDGISGE